MAGSREELIENAREMIDLYMKAERAVLLNQSYSIGGQSLTRADLDKIRAGRKEWEDKLTVYIGVSPRRMRQIIPLDT